MRINTRNFLLLCLALISPHSVQAGFLLEVQFWVQNIVCFLSKFIGTRPCSRVDPRCPQCLPLSPENFSLAKFIDSTWYVQKQQPVWYQDENSLYCTLATYNSVTYSDLIRVNNYDNLGGVNSGIIRNTADSGYLGRLCAEQRKGGSLLVSQCVFTFAMELFSGPYWVVAVGKKNITITDDDDHYDDDHYSGSGSGSGSKSKSGSEDYHIEYAENEKKSPSREDDDESHPNDDDRYYPSGSGDDDDKPTKQEVYTWAIITGGQPDVVRATEPKVLCANRRTRNFFEDITYRSGSGMWFFTRDEHPSDETIAEMEAAAYELGIYTGDMIDVEQEGCTYDGATIK